MSTPRPVPPAEPAEPGVAPAVASVRRRHRRRRAVAAVGAACALAGTLAAVGPASPAAADAPLAGSYVGQVNGDFGSVAGLTMDISGPATAVNAWTTIGDGARIDCHGNQAVGFRQLNLTGARSSVNADGTADYELLGRFEFDSTVHVVVDLGLHGHLSADGTSFNGTVDVRVKPTIGSACYRVWSFSTTNNVRTVPDVIDWAWAPARDAIAARGLVPVRRVQVDYTCNHQNTVWRLHPSAGSSVLVGTVIDVVIGVRDYRRPCP